MNKAYFIGNLTRDPELRTINSAEQISVCSFTIAVNKRSRRSSAEAGQPDADFIRVTAWRQLGELCAKYLAKGRKVAVTGSVSASAYIGKDGQAHGSIELTADDIEFLTPRGEQGENVPYAQPAPAAAPAAGSNTYMQVDDDELPF